MSGYVPSLLRKRGLDEGEIYEPSESTNKKPRGDEPAATSATSSKPTASSSSFLYGSYPGYPVPAASSAASSATSSVSSTSSRYSSYPGHSTPAASKKSYTNIDDILNTSLANLSGLPSYVTISDISNNMRSNGDKIPNTEFIDTYLHYIQNYIGKDYIYSPKDPSKYNVINNKTHGINYINCAFNYIQNNNEAIESLYVTNNNKYYLIDGMNIIANRDFLKCFILIIYRIALNLPNSSSDIGKFYIGMDPTQDPVYINKQIILQSLNFIIKNIVTNIPPWSYPGVDHSHKILLVENILPTLLDQIFNRKLSTTNYYRDEDPFLREYVEELRGHDHNFRSDSVKSFEPILINYSEPYDPHDKTIFIVTYHTPHQNHIITHEFARSTVHLLPTPTCLYNSSLLAPFTPRTRPVSYINKKYNILQTKFLGGKNRKTIKKNKKHRKTIKKQRGGDQESSTHNESDDHILLYIYLYLSFKPDNSGNVFIISNDRFNWFVKNNQLYNLSDDYKKTFRYLSANLGKKYLSSTLINKSGFRIIDRIRKAQFIITSSKVFINDDIPEDSIGSMEIQSSGRYDLRGLIKSATDTFYMFLNTPPSE